MIPADHLLELNILGESQPIDTVRRLIKKIAPIDAPVFIHGETGTGKELVARSLHYCSVRANEPFVPVNCGAISSELFLSELFGHEKGAFTDAKVRKKGLLEEAHNGTLFLDEIDSLCLATQVTLLRLLQESEYRPVGSSQTKTANVRIICASNRDITELISQQKFREDLFYRLEVLALNLPPLRDRKEDILVLADHFIQQISLQYNLQAKKLSHETLNWFSNYSWPGNVRELENWLTRACLTQDSEQLYPPGVNIPTSNSSSVSENIELGTFQEEKSKAVARFESDYIQKLLSMCAGNITQAAKMANKDRRAFGRLVKKYGVDRERFC